MWVDEYRATGSPPGTQKFPAYHDPVATAPGSVFVLVPMDTRHQELACPVGFANGMDYVAPAELKIPSS